ncbi:GNAT family N-acetyltransferase [Candidatus Daviesbacteria bacterium]|nr:GNAT family N-acetyltransferase [Candidatus Daviesbacteria bacterium]
MIRIRIAKPKNVKAIFKLVNQEARHGKILPRTRSEIQKEISSFFVAEEKKQIVGCVQLDVYSKKLAEIRSLVVDKNFRSNGIGSSLLRLCLKRAKQKRIREVLAVTADMPYFKKHGFKTVLDEKFALFWQGSKRR